VSGNVSDKYDSSFRVTSQILNGVETVKFKYDNDGMLTNVGAMALNYNAQNGLLTGTTLGNVTTSHGYSSYGELSSYTANYNSSTIFQTTYTRDALGRITTLNETELGVAKTLNYSYDAVGSLTKVWRNDTLVSQYVYDANGNRIVHITPTSIDSGTYDAQDRMLSYAGAQYFYTANGDLQLKISGTDTTRYTYDAFGNLMQVVMPNGDVIQYVIDGQNRRIAKRVNGRIVDRWLYAEQLTPIAELDSADNVIARFSGGYLNKMDAIYQIITDHLPSKFFICRDGARRSWGVRDLSSM
jgi:YD repeat-containing protein